MYKNVGYISWGTCKREETSNHWSKRALVKEKNKRNELNEGGGKKS